MSESLGYPLRSHKRREKSWMGEGKGERKVWKAPRHSSPQASPGRVKGSPRCSLFSFIGKTAFQDLFPRLLRAEGCQQPCLQGCLLLLQNKCGRRILSQDKEYALKIMASPTPPWPGSHFVLNQLHKVICLSRTGNHYWKYKHGLPAGQCAHLLPCRLNYTLNFEGPKRNEKFKESSQNSDRKKKWSHYKNNIWGHPQKLFPGRPWEDTAILCNCIYVCVWYGLIMSFW